MIIVRLWGGLGNQLFQYAYAYAAAERNHSELCLDTSYYSENKNMPEHAARPKIFDLPISERNTQIPDSVKKSIAILHGRNINRLIRIPPKSKLKIGSYTYIKESRFRYQPWLREVDKPDVYFDGYWQCEKYFEDFRSQLQEQFVPTQVSASHDRWLAEIDHCNSVAIHIRRGDYVNNHNPFSNLYLLESPYFQESIRYIKEHVDNPVFYIFTNDVAWVKEALPHWNIQARVVSQDRTLSDLDEFSLMKHCCHQIISNSTFSWWPAWLNDRKEKIVIAPDRWFGNRDILCPDWVRIPVK